MIWLLQSSIAAAQEHGAEAAHSVVHEAAGIPWHNISVQTFNFLFLLFVLGWLMRKAVKSHFAHRAQSFQELVDRAENAKKKAEETHNAIKDRLAKLESSAEQSVAQVRSEAAELKSRLLAEAKSLAEKLGVEAARSTAVELEKAKTGLRRELLSKALATSEETLKKGLGSTEQKKLQNEFAEKIEVVSG